MYSEVLQFKWGWLLIKSRVYNNYVCIKLTKVLDKASDARPSISFLRLRRQKNVWVFIKIPPWRNVGHLRENTYINWPMLFCNREVHIIWLHVTVYRIPKSSPRTSRIVKREHIIDIYMFKMERIHGRCPFPLMIERFAFSCFSFDRIMVVNCSDLCPRSR